MKQEDKGLLLIDLCGRLPYGVKVSVNQSQLQNYDYKWKNWGFEEEPQELDGVSIYGVTFGCMDTSDGVISFEFIKPYLFPLSSMTEEQKKEYYSLADDITIKPGHDCRLGIKIHCIKLGISNNPHEEVWDYIDLDALDWLNKNHFDYRGLIPKGLAIDAAGLNIY